MDRSRAKYRIDRALKRMMYKSRKGTRSISPKAIRKTLIEEAKAEEANCSRNSSRQGLVDNKNDKGCRIIRNGGDCVRLQSAYLI